MSCKKCDCFDCREYYDKLDHPLKSKVRAIISEYGRMVDGRFFKHDCGISLEEATKQVLEFIPKPTDKQEECKHGAPRHICKECWVSDIADKMGDPELTPPEKGCECNSWAKNKQDVMVCTECDKPLFPPSESYTKSEEDEFRRDLFRFIEQYLNLVHMTPEKKWSGIESLRKKYNL